MKGDRNVNERDIERALVRRVAQVGGAVRKVQWLGRRGAPDRLVLLPSHAWHAPLWVELKAPGKAPTRQQLHEHAVLRAMGQRVTVIDSLGAIEELFPLPQEGTCR